MPKFEFKAYTKEGKLKEGIISEENKEQAIKILQNQDLLITYLAEKKQNIFYFLQKPGLKDIYIFTKQLSYLLKAKTPLDEAIKSLSETTSNSSLRSALIEVYNDLISGISFSNSLSRFPDFFNSFYIGMIKIGESIGALDEVLDYLSLHLNNQFRFKNKIAQASIYPIIVFLLFIGIMIALFYFIVPQIAKMFIENNIPMPTITKIFQSISLFITKFGLFLIIILISLVYYLSEYFKTQEGRVYLYKFIDSLPIFGNIIKNLYSAQFLESLHYLLKGGVPIIEALEIIKDNIGHPHYELALEKIIDDVKKGKPLSESMSQFPQIFSSLVIEGMRTAEKTGQLGEITYTIFNFYNETIENQIGTLTETLQPVLIIILGIGLGLLEASLFIPLLTLTKYVQTF
jgi:type IV pilus assembly protein PilC